MKELQFNTPYSYEGNNKGLKTTEPTKTRPNGSLTLEQLFNLYRHGTLIEPQIKPIEDPALIDFLAEMNDKDLTQLDAIRTKASELLKRRDDALKEFEQRISNNPVNVVPEELIIAQQTSN